MRDGFSPPDPVRAIKIAGCPIWLDVSGAAYEPKSKALLVADLHFEKGSAFGTRGQMLPPYDTRATLERLSALIDQFQPDQLISLGDSFHDMGADGRMHGDDIARLKALIDKIPRWVWITGNHDPHPSRLFAGEVVEDLALGDLTLRHEPQKGQSPGEIAGHLHPCAKVNSRGKSFRRRCFASDGTRLVLPAFGAYTGGLNVCDLAWRPIFETKPDVWLLGDRSLFPVSGKKLRGD